MIFKIKQFFYIIFYRAFGFVAPQEGENIILERIFAKKKKGFYIDVGAHHPIRFSNTFNLYQRGWIGINIEPNKKNIRYFEKYRPRDINLNIAINNNNKKTVYYQFNDPALNTTDIKIKNLRVKHGLAYKKNKINTDTLKNVLLEHCKKNQIIDLLKIDVEGNELEVLKSNDWSTFVPKVIICEFINVDVEKLLSNQVYKFLKKKNYLLFCKLLQNGIFIHKDYIKSTF